MSICRSVRFKEEEINLFWAGSILSGGGSVPAQRASPEAWINMVNDFQKGSLSTRLGIPMIYGIDAVHGHNNVYKATIFPHNIGLGATRQVDLPWILTFRLVSFVNLVSAFWILERKKQPFLSLKLNEEFYDVIIVLCVRHLIKNLTEAFIFRWCWQIKIPNTNKFV